MEFEKLAIEVIELGKALPKIVVTFSAESLSMRRMERDTAAVDSSGLLHPPTVSDESSVGYDVGKEPPSAKEKSHIIIPGRGTEEPGARPSEPTSVAVFSSSKKSLSCVYLPDTLSSPPRSYQAAQLLRSYNLHTASTASQHRQPDAHANAPCSQHSKNPNQRAASPSV
ncbi:hypothetical protein BGY98DRAFT_305230 [Russula aff. rugulosa BPL654]|nr:hypothetical protein BGY98DRAFT_305230 [Russula aff. rugulosa BPL654]